MTFEDALRADVRALLHEEAGMFRAELRVLVRAEMLAALQSLSASAPGEILSVEEAAAICKVRPKTIRARIRSGQLPALKPRGSRLYRIRRSDLDACFTGNGGVRTERSAVEQAAGILAKVHRPQEK